MIPVSAAEKILAEITFFVSTFLDKYRATTNQGEKHKTKITKLQKQK